MNNLDLLRREIDLGLRDVREGRLSARSAKDIASEVLRKAQASRNEADGRRAEESLRYKGR
jgi:polyhydroxyalkanoate synthesis regulator phasin